MHISRYVSGAFGAVLVALAVTLPGVACSCGSSNSSTTGLTTLEQDTGVQWLAWSDFAFTATSTLYPLSPPPASLTSDATPQAAAMAFLAKYADIFQIADAAQELDPEESGGPDAAGLRFASFTQKEGAASVYGSRLTVVFDAGGHIAFVRGVFVPGLHAFATTPTLSPEQAAAKGQADMVNQYPTSALVSLESTPAPVLTIYAANGAPVLAYSLRVSYASDTLSGTLGRARAVTDYVIDAHSGAILLATTGLLSQYTGKDVSFVHGSGKGEIAQATKSASSVDFTVLATGPMTSTAKAPYYMQDYTSATTTEYPPLYVHTSGNSILTSTDPNTWDEGVPNAGSAVDTFFYLEEVTLWWKKQGRNSYDNAGGVLGLYPHDTVSLNAKGEVWADNAWWDRSGTIHVAPSSGKPAFHYATSVDLSTMAHEFQHAVTQYVLNLEYAGEAGAIDESMSDVFAEFVSHDIASADFIIGELAYTNAGINGFRDLANPHSSGLAPQPDSVLDKRFHATTPVDPSTDWGGVHYNSGVPSFAWYLTGFGGTDDTSSFSVPSCLALDWNNLLAL
jgi:bacillolysin